MLTAIEDDHKHDPDVPRADVVLVDVALEPADNTVIGSRQYPSGADGVICTDVRNYIDLGTECHVAANEFAEKGCEWATDEPESNRVEDQLIAAVGIFLPTRKLIIDLYMVSKSDIVNVRRQLTVRDTPS